MFTAVHEWSPPGPGKQAPGAFVNSHLSAAPREGAVADLYRRLLASWPDAAAREKAAQHLREQLEQAQTRGSDLPEEPQDLIAWMQCNAQLVTAKYSAYLEERKAGAPRRYFQNRAHALYFLRAVAPTKLVDGAWLYGLVAHAGNPRLRHLVRTYVEELGQGVADKNHVLLYRKLLDRHGLDTAGLGDAFHEQGLIQLALGWNAQDFLPEVIGFNLGYEQMPLHLLITAHELNELGVDPYYFTLHVTVDNTDTGHARQACEAVLETLPQLGESDTFWQRVRNGSKLGCAGLGTADIVQGFDIGSEALRIFMQKSQAGHGAHSDYCRIGGRSVNDWLSQPEQVPAFLAALEQAGWIKRGSPAKESRFWGLLQGERAEMFGVFSGYELQVIHDWIRGPASADGQAYTETTPTRRRANYRALMRHAAQPVGVGAGHELLDPDLDALNDQLESLDADARLKLLADAMAPARHWTPAGLHATRLFCEAIA